VVSRRSGEGRDLSIQDVFTRTIRSSDMGNRSAVLSDPLDDQAPPMTSESGLTVSHEIPSSAMAQSPLHSEVFTHPRIVTNVPAGYS
jgi:hypothetical protein